VTRINVIPPEHLTDAHLLAEYRELPRVFALARPDPRPVERYTLGPGHVRFFYPRTGYLSRRQSAIIAECLSRGFNIAHRTAPLPVAGLDDDWTPDAAAVAVNLSRLRDKLAARPGFYTYGGIVVSPDFY
jgi:deoxyribonuclease (pyrimidine dimer)